MESDRLFFSSIRALRTTPHMLFLRILVCVKVEMRLMRLRVREFAQERGWTLKEVSNKTGIVKLHNEKPKRSSRNFPEGMMKRVEKHVIKRGHDWFDYCDTASLRSRYGTIKSLL